MFEPALNVLDGYSPRRCHRQQQPGAVSVDVGQNVKADQGGAVIKEVLSVLRPRGSLIQVGVTGEVPIPINAIVGKEIRMVGAFRFHGDYAVAARLIKEGRINVKPIITATLPFERAVEAFEMAADRRSQMKVQLTF